MLKQINHVIHLSDTGILVNEIIDVVRDLKSWIILSNGLPIYHFIRDNRMIESLLVKARHNLELMLKYTDIAIVDHHINRCYEGYDWIRNMKRLYENVMTAAQYVRNKPLLLEA